MQIIDSSEFDAYWNNAARPSNSADTENMVRVIIDEVRKDGDAAVRRFAAKFDKSSPEKLEVPKNIIIDALRYLRRNEPELAASLDLAAEHIRYFAEQQKKQFIDFECEVAEGVFAGQKVIPVQRAAVYAPAGRFPLISSVLMGVIPALAAGAEVFVVSPPLENGLPDTRIMAAAALAGSSRVFAVGGAQAVAAMAFGTESLPKVDMIAGPGNKYVATAKRLLFGEVGVDFIAGPTDVLIIAGANANPDFIAVDMLAQAEHDPDARARALVPNRRIADAAAWAVERRLAAEPATETARDSLDAGGLIITYHSIDDAVRIANIIAPEHLELQSIGFLPGLVNFGALFMGSDAAEVLGDYSAGPNHTLPTSGSARFSGGLSVRHFLKTVTTLRCNPLGKGYAETVKAAEVIACAEGLTAHAESAVLRLSSLAHQNL
ncbi:MAG: histidinol dehydrogenase [Treponema sp.]|jgi:histidinol dehydrogenase|nr:histidinol dehydrogenase [Treponema sp.]